jgi:hypothetical protein
MRQNIESQLEDLVGEKVVVIDSYAPSPSQFGELTSVEDEFCGHTDIRYRVREGTANFYARHVEAMIYRNACVVILLAENH